MSQCATCKHFCFANGAVWCEDNQVMDFFFPAVANCNPCPHYELAPQSEGTISVTGTTNIAHDTLVKASRLAESVLMDWDKAEQVELAKAVAIMTKNLLNKDEEQ